MSVKQVKTGLWSRSDLLFCDRCGSKIIYGFHPVCSDCLGRDPTTIRPYEYGEAVYGTNAAQNAPRCSRCAMTLERANRYHVCPACTRAHPDASHRVGMTTFGALAPGEMEGASRALHCASCGCAQILKRLADGAIDVAYYVPGSREPRQCLPRCGDTTALLETVQRVQGCGSHDWVLVKDTVKVDASLEDIDQINAKLGPDFPLYLDENLATKLQLGSQIYWCSRCGAWADLAPSVKIRVHVRPPEPPRTSL